LSSDAALRAQVAGFLAAHTTLTLATIGAEGPSAAAVFYAHDVALTLYFLSEDKTHHAQDLRGDPRAAATIQTDGQNWRDIRGLQLRGRAEPVPAPAMAHAAAVYGRKFAFVGTLLAGAEGSAVLTGPLARARFWRFVPTWFRLVDNTVRFGHKAELHLEAAPYE
jgi:uncharacterized protein YhbP (UPF0306 family)